MTNPHDSLDASLAAAGVASQLAATHSSDAGEPGPGEALLSKQLVKRALFPRRATPVQIGRFVVLGMIGRGGMGVVYACHDDLLDRKVAVKILHGEVGRERASARLRREAQALAKLSHPNVVAIHDVGMFGDRVYLAMEFVDGQTFGAWLGAARRSWRDVLRVVLAAGDGLAAAHDKGLVHRDIKPDNLMIAADGRVRVMDFGLACVGGEATGARPAVTGDALAAELTRTGALMGTPAYMASEQFLGEATDARTDQFALCATAWEALYGQPAFAGDTLMTLAAAVTDGAVAPPPAHRDVPVWLRRVLERGLQARPDRRFDDTRALLAALRADPTRRRRSLGVGLGLGLVALAGLGVHQAAHQRSVAACEAAGADIFTDWDDAARAGLERSLLATGKPYAATTYARTAPWFDRWADAWRTAATATCTAHFVDETWDADLHARADDCLSEARGHFTALIEALREADADALARATAAAAGLPAVDACTRPELLRQRPMIDPDQRREVLDVRARLARAGSLESAGRFDAGRKVADEALAGAHATGWSPIVAQAELRAGELAERAGDYAGAEASLLRALAAARAARSPYLAMAATIDLVFVVGYRTSRPAEGKVWAQAASTQLALVAGEHPLEQADLDSNLAGTHYVESAYDEAAALYTRALATREATLGEAHPRVADSLNNVASVHFARGAHDEAARLFARALALYEQTLGPDHPDVATALSNLALVRESTGDYAAAIPLLTRAADIRAAALGPDHPQVASGLSNLALVHEGMGSYEQAATLFLQAQAIRERALGPDHPQVADCLHNLGTVRHATGDNAEAARLFHRALAIYERTLAKDHPTSANTIASLAELHTIAGEYDEAVALYTRALAIHEAALGPDHPTLAHALHGLGQTYVSMGRVDDGVALLERARTIREASDGPPDDLADTRFALARALAPTHADRAHALASEALRAYASVPATDDRQAAVRAWLAAHAP